MYGLAWTFEFSQGLCVGKSPVDTVRVPLIVCLPPRGRNRALLRARSRDPLRYPG